jgi:hypothetical protein
MPSAINPSHPVPVSPTTQSVRDNFARAQNEITQLQNQVASLGPGGGGGAMWGSITGTLGAQTDLNTALNGKQTILVSGSNIRTVNGNSLIGSGDVAIAGGGGQVTDNIQIQTNVPQFDFRTGTVAPTNLQALGIIRFMGATGTGTWNFGATIGAQAVGAWDGSNRSTLLNFDVMNGTTPRRGMQINENGGVNIGNASGAPPGQGEINVQNIRINGVPLLTWLAGQTSPW